MSTKKSVIKIRASTSQKSGPRMNMNINTFPKLIRKAIENLNQNPTLWRRSRELGKIMRQNEKTFFNKYAACPPETLEKLRNKLGNINYTKLKKLSNQYFYDPEVMQLISCLVSSLFIDRKNGLSSIEMVKSWISIKSIIGEPSAVGIAMIADLSGSKDLFVVKVPKSTFANDDLIHEWFVGTYGTNKLRKYIPNFAYVYGGFTCSSPVLDQRNVITYCNSHNKLEVNYVIYENISPSISLMDYSLKNSLNFTDWLSYYLQILFALKIAQDLIDFTHYDLHLGNVLLRDISLGSSFHIPYNYKNKIFYVKTNRVATMIDYGSSHIKHNDKHYGFPGLENYGVNPEKSRPLHDVFKLLGFTIYHLARKFQKTKAKPILGFLKSLFPIAKFFYDYDLTTEINKPFILLLQYSQSFPETKQINQFTIDDLIDYILANSELQPHVRRIIQVRSRIDNKIKNVISYDINTHRSFDVRLSELNLEISDGLYKNLVINNTIEFYDIINGTTSETQKKSVMEDFRSISDIALKTDIFKLFKLYDEIINKRTQPLVKIAKTLENIRIVFNKVLDLSKIVDHLTKIKIYQKSIGYTLGIYETSKLDHAYKLGNDTWNLNIPHINKFIRIYLFVINDFLLWTRSKISLSDDFEDLYIQSSGYFRNSLFYFQNNPLELNK